MARSWSNLCSIQLSLSIVGSWNRCRRIGIVIATIAPIVSTIATTILGSSHAEIVISFLLRSLCSPNIRIYPPLGVPIVVVVVVVAPIIIVPVIATVVLWAAIGALIIQVALGHLRSGQSIGFLCKLSNH